MAGNNSNNTDDGPQYDWKARLIAFEVINVTMLVVTLWVLLCMIVYGTKTRRWVKKPQGSSLNSGMIYTTCVVAVALIIPRHVSTEMLFKLPGIENGLKKCELVCDLGNGAYAIATSATYFFIWLRQRLIYTHPYVQARVGKRANFFSILVLVMISIASIALLCFYTVPNAYEEGPYGCIHRKQRDSFFEGTGRNVIIALALFIVQGLVICLCAYPAIRVKFDTKSSEGSESRNSPSSRLQEFRKSVSIRNGPTSPIQLSVRRTMIACVIMVFSDIIALVPMVIFMPKDAPAPFRRTIYNAGLFVNVFCMLGTFGFGAKILTLFCPSCSKQNLRFKKRPVEPRHDHAMQFVEMESTTSTKMEVLDV